MTTSVGSHTGSPNRHWTTTTFSAYWDYYQIFCFEPDWPNGITGTSANNVAWGIDNWNDWILNGNAVDFRYGRAGDNCDNIAEDVDVRYEAMQPGQLGEFAWAPFWDLDGAGHLKHGVLRIAARSDVFYGGCCPVWQGTNDTRYHVQSIAGHEAGHAAILSDPGMTNGCCEAELNEAGGKHSNLSSHLMHQNLYHGELKYVTTREVEWLYSSYGEID